MGRLIVALARRLLPGVEVLRGSRHARPDREPDSRAVDLHDPASLRAALAGVAAVINAVGPFDYDPAPLVGACLEAGCHYVDIAETPAFLDRVEAAARQTVPPRPVHAVGGCSTVPGLVEVLAQSWAGREDVRRVRVFLGMGSRNSVSPALLYSLLQPLAGRAPDGTGYFGRLVRKRPRGLPTRLYGRYPSAFDRRGIRVGDSILPAAFHAGFDRGYIAYLLWCAARLVPHISPKGLHSVCRLTQPLVPLVQALGTPVGVLALEGLDGHGRVTAAIEVRAEREGLTVPALPAVWAARRLLAPEPLPTTASLRLEQLLTPQQACAWLRQEGCRVAGLDNPG
jgi:hypothetical protein